MRMDKFTSRFQQALADAQSLAVGRDHNQIDPAHVLQALIEQDGGSTLPLLAQSGANVDSVKARLAALLDNLPKIGNPTGEVNVGSDLARLLNLTDKLAQGRRDQFVAELRHGASAIAAAREVDATGLMVTPGFDDIHTHYDGQVTWENRMIPS